MGKADRSNVVRLVTRAEEDEACRKVRALLDSDTMRRLKAAAAELNRVRKGDDGQS